MENLEEVETERKTGLSMVQRTVLKVDISCDKCKKKILKAVSSLPGVDKIEIDGDKGTLTVTGEADPYEIIMRTKKSGKFVQVMSIGPPPAPPKKPNEKKPEEKKPEIKGHMAHAYIHNPHNCHVCAQMPVVQMVRFNEPNPPCTIM